MLRGRFCRSGREVSCMQTADSSGLPRDFFCDFFFLPPAEPALSLDCGCSEPCLLPMIAACNHWLRNTLLQNGKSTPPKAHYRLGASGTQLSRLALRRIGQPASSAKVNAPDSGYATVSFPSPNLKKRSGNETTIVSRARRNIRS